MARLLVLFILLYAASSFRIASASGLCASYICPMVYVHDHGVIYAGKPVTVTIETSPSYPYFGPSGDTPIATSIEGLNAMWVMGPVFSFSMSRIDNTFYLTGTFDSPFDSPGESYYWFLAGDNLGVIGCNSNCNVDEVFDVQSAPSVPEPSTWAMLLNGFYAIGLTVRLRRNATVPGRDGQRGKCLPQEGLGRRGL